MLVRESRRRPKTWAEQRHKVAGWFVPLLAVEWLFEWLAYVLSRWAFLEVLEYLGILSVLFGVIFYYSEAGDRQKQKHYQAWQVINTAQGKGGSGGRIEALQELNADRVPLVGVDASVAFLQGVHLPHAQLARANLSGSDIREGVFRRSDIEYADLRSANFRHGDLSEVNLQNADLEDAYLVGATLAAADLSGANLTNADLSYSDLRGIVWRRIKAVNGCNVYGVRNAPDGFLAWALQNGATSLRSNDQ